MMISQQSNNTLPQLSPQLKYVMKFVYLDGKELNITGQVENLQKLFSAISQKTFYWDQTNTTGFYTDMELVRFVQVYLHMPEPQIEQEKNSVYTTDEVKNESSSPKISAQAA